VFVCWIPFLHWVKSPPTSDNKKRLLKLLEKKKQCYIVIDNLQNLSGTILDLKSIMEAECKTVPLNVLQDFVPRTSTNESTTTTQALTNTREEKEEKNKKKQNKDKKSNEHNKKRKRGHERDEIENKTKKQKTSSKDKPKTETISKRGGRTPRGRSRTGQKK